MAKQYVSVDRTGPDVIVWDRPVRADGDGDFCRNCQGNPDNYIGRFHKGSVATDCPPGECREIEGGFPLVIPTVKPRTVQDVKEEIVQKAVVYLLPDQGFRMNFVEVDGAEQKLIALLQSDESAMKRIGEMVLEDWLAGERRD